MQFSPVCCQFIPPSSHQRPVLNTLNVRDQVSYPYETTGKIIVYLNLYILHSSREDELRGSKHYPNLQFWFVTVVPSSTWSLPHSQTYYRYHIMIPKLEDYTAQHYLYKLALWACNQRYDELCTHEWRHTGTWKSRHNISCANTHK
jgi:hypothetical protein